MPHQKTRGSKKKILVRPHKAERRQNPALGAHPSCGETGSPSCNRLSGTVCLGLFTFLPTPQNAPKWLTPGMHDSVTSGAHVLDKRVWRKHEWSAIQGAPTVKKKAADCRSLPSTQQHSNMPYKHTKKAKDAPRAVHSKFPSTCAPLLPIPHTLAGVCASTYVRMFTGKPLSSVGHHWRILRNAAPGP